MRYQTVSLHSLTLLRAGLTSMMDLRLFTEMAAKGLADEHAIRVVSREERLKEDGNGFTFSAVEVAISELR